jgi:single-stranded-DNA-specific exonuclease
LNKTKRLGLQKMLLEARLLENDGTKKRKFDAYTIGFQIAPRINAAGRISHSNVAFNLLMSDRGTDAVDLAYELDQNNKERQVMTEELVTDAITQVEAEDSPVICVLGKGWPTGLVGLIAGKLKEKYQKPALVMALNNHEITGSGRSINGFNLIECLQEMPQFFSKFGGHPMACGFTLASEEALGDFKIELNKKFEEKMKDVDLTPILNIDAEISLEQVDWELYDLLEKFAPFGMANEKPKYLTRAVEVFSLKAVGKDFKHLNMTLKQDNKIRKSISWGMCNGNEPNWCNTLKAGDLIDIVYEIDVNEWNGNRELQLTIVDLKKSQ